MSELRGPKDGDVGRRGDVDEDHHDKWQGGGQHAPRHGRVKQVLKQVIEAEPEGDGG